MSVIKRTAACECGKYSAECIDQPIRIGICRCNTCLEKHGKDQTIFAFYLRSKVKLIGNTNEYMPRSSEVELTDAFSCESCGYTLIHEVPIFPELVSVAFHNPNDGLFGGLAENFLIHQPHDWYRDKESVPKILF